MKSLLRAAAILLLVAAPALAADAKPTSDPSALMDAGHYKRARGLVEQRYRANPNDAEANYLQARIKNAFGQPDEALKFAERALELNSSVGVYHGMLAQIYGDKARKAGLL